MNLNPILCAPPPTNSLSALPLCKLTDSEENEDEGEEEEEEDINEEYKLGEYEEEEDEGGR